MHIAVSAVFFSETRGIAIHRPRHLAAQLARRGHSVTVYAGAEDPEFSQPPPPGVELVELENWGRRPLLNGARETLKWLRRHFSSKSPDTSQIALRSSDAGKSARRPTRLGRAANVTLSHIEGLDDFWWSWRARRRIKADAKSRAPFDAVFSTSGPLGSARVGRLLVRLNPASKWICDFRDPLPQASQAPLIRHRRQRAERRLVWAADAITVVSEGCKAGILARVPEADSNKIHVVTNGFWKTPDESSVFEEPSDPPEREERVLRIGYTGTLYEGKSDLTMLFRALRESRLALDNCARVEFHYAGADERALRRAAAKQEAEDLIVAHGFLPYADAVALQRRMDILIVLTWNNPGDTGVLTGKFMEYLAAEKPILALVSGTEPGSELAALVERLDVGIACEQANEKEDYLRLRAYLWDALTKVGNGYPVTFEPATDAVNEFDYENIGRQLEALLLNLVQQ